ncbi:MAG TPA: HAMP domain-containing sensor histidine kinase [Solirubrobacteraceae bacterium]|nr:HAMP domain-containing sensor histidine kinase [Solirubrobacteraceae bacterium]
MRATFSAYRRIPLRWRLAGGSAALTCVILATFAAIVGVLTDRDLHGQFNNEVRSNSDQLASDLHLKWVDGGFYLNCKKQDVSLKDYTSAEHAQIRIYNDAGGLLCTQKDVKVKGVKFLPETPYFAPPVRGGTYTENGYQVVSRQLNVQDSPVWLLYARPLSDVDQPLARVHGILVLGVLGGTVLALLGGLATAARAMRPIKQLTAAAREIERTRDPTLRVPQPEAEDEVAELARTVEGMLGSLDAARSETHAALESQREFVADASHELRTPLTSLLANLELLGEELDGEQADTAQAALRSARRMRRLVGDLLLLARADARRGQARGPTDLAGVLLEAASELGPMAEDHELSIDAQSAVVPGVRDDLHRLTLNLIENAVRHTPPGTHIRACTGVENGTGILSVQDDGPGIPPELGRRVFERFVRGARTGTRGSGLGLAIVRAVAESHGGTVTLEEPEVGTGTRFVVTIPRDTSADPAEPLDAQPVTAAPTPRRRRNR